MNNLSVPVTEKVEVKSFTSDKVNEIVSEILKQHIGGKEFFEHLDLAVQTKDVIQLLYDQIDKFSDGELLYYISTGKFGIFFNNWITAFGSDIDFVYLINGGIREGEPVSSLESFKSSLNGNSFVIVDDSCYSLTTIDNIKNHIESLGATYKGSFVVYDGSKEDRKDIHSLYKYYDTSKT